MSLLFLGVLLSLFQHSFADPDEQKSYRLPDSFSDLGQKYSWDCPLGSAESPYSSILPHWVKNLPKEIKFENSNKKDHIEIIGIETPHLPFYIGVAHRVLIKAPFARAEEVFDHFTNYPKLFKGLLSAKTLEADGNRLVTFWEEHIPIPFVPNIRSEIIYLISSLGKTKKLYRYGLKSSNRLIHNDGFMLIEALSNDETQLTEIDFFNANWGLLKSLGSNHAWKESITGLMQTDFALKLAAENPEWESKKVVETSESMADSVNLEPILKHKLKIDLPD